MCWGQADCARPLPPGRCGGVVPAGLLESEHCSLPARRARAAGGSHLAVFCRDPGGPEGTLRSTQERACVAVETPRGPHRADLCRVLEPFGRAGLSPGVMAARAHPGEVRVPWRCPSPPSSALPGILFSSST